MKSFVTSILSLVLLLGVTSAFLSASIATKGTKSTMQTAPLFGYVPDGFTEESYSKFKEDEKKKKKVTNLGHIGPRGFQSRSLRSFHEALNTGEASHLFPATDSKKRLAKKEIKHDDIPYMQRGGAWDNSDIKGSKNQKKWLDSDKEYEADGSKKQNSASILGWGVGLDWTGTQKSASASPAAKFGRNYKPPNVNEIAKEEDRYADIKKDSTVKKHKLFGLF